MEMCWHVYMSCLDEEHWLMYGSGRRPLSFPFQTSLQLHALHKFLTPSSVFHLSFPEFSFVLPHSYVFCTSLDILSSFCQFRALGFSFLVFFFPSLFHCRAWCQYLSFSSHYLTLSPSPLIGSCGVQAEWPASVAHDPLWPWQLVISMVTDGWGIARPCS